MQIEVTWWADDGTERKGRVYPAPDSSPETAAALARMMRLADADAAAAQAEAAGPGENSGRDYGLKNA